MRSVTKNNRQRRAILALLGEVMAFLGLGLVAVTLIAATIINNQ